MRTQYSIILFVLCMNLACLIVYEAVPALAQGLPPITQQEAVEEVTDPATSLRYLNQTSIIAQVGVMIGDVLGGLTSFVRTAYWLVDGFPHMLEYFGAPSMISWSLRIAFWFSISIMVAEVIMKERISD